MDQGELPQQNAIVRTFISSLYSLMGHDEEAKLFLEALTRLSSKEYLYRKLELALNQARLDVPSRPVGTTDDAGGGLRKLWDDLRAFSLQTTETSVIIRDAKPTAVHHMAEQFHLGHVSLPGRAVKVFKRPAGPPATLMDPNWDAEHHMYFDTIQRFLASSASTYNFPAYLNSSQRAKVHEVASLFSNLDHDTFGSKKQRDRYVRITKVDPVKRQRLELLSYALQQQQQQQQQNSVDSYGIPLHALGASTPSSSEGCQTPLVTEDGWRVCNFNIQWMDQALEDKIRCTNIANVIRELNATVLCVQEGPSSVEKMQTFVATYLEDAYQVHGGLEELRQQIFVLVKRKGPIEQVELFQPAMDYLSQPWQFDLNGDRLLLQYKFARRPVVIKARLAASGRDVFVVAVHMKSMKISNGEELCRKDLDKFIERSIVNRRRIGAECFRVRQCLEETIFSQLSSDTPPQDKDPYVVVCGDLNTGPGRDFFERYFLLFDVVDVLQGSPFNREKKLFAMLINHLFVPPSQQWSAIFRDCLEGDVKHVLVDHVFVNRPGKRKVVKAGVAHDIFERNGGPSDHRPVYVDFSDHMDSNDW